jgi:hypothetical protein
MSVTTNPNSTRDGGGNWQSGGAPTTKTYECRYEPNTGNRVLIGEGGKKIDYSGTVYFKSSDVLIIGQQVTVTLHSGSVIKGSVKGFHPGQLNSRLWL